MEPERLDIHSDIARASSLPGAFYGSPEWFERSKERVFASSWQFVSDARVVGGPGAQWPFTLLPGVVSEPLVLVRGDQDELACFSNVCTHRGNLIAGAACRARHLVCRYHGRRFGLDGKLVSMPEFEGVLGFPASSDDLPRVPTATLGPLAFVSLTPDHSFEALVADLRERVGWLPIDEFRADPSRSRDYEFEANWALYCDNYLEGFHIPYLHGELNAKIEFQSYKTELFTRSNVQIAHSKPDEPAFELPASSPQHGQRIAAYYFWLWPNLMLNFYPWGLSLNHVQPLSPTRTRVAFRTWIWREDLLDRGAGSGLHRVELEDESAIVNVQRGVRSRFYTRGRFSPTQELGTHHFHRLLAAALA